MRLLPAFAGQESMGFVALIVIKLASFLKGFFDPTYIYMLLRIKDRP